MTIPDFQTIMLPLLKFCADEKEHTNREAIDYLAEKFDLPDAERKELLPSGRQAVFDNRIAWSRAHLKMAKLIENTQRGVFRITDRGKTVLKEGPQRIDINYLTQFPEYAERREAIAKNTKSPMKRKPQQKPNPLQHQRNKLKKPMKI